jgi:hypothetical protein
MPITPAFAAVYGTWRGRNGGISPTMEAVADR